MTREEALKLWLPIIKQGVETMPELNQALDMAIKALEQQTCDDCVSRQAVLETIETCNNDGLKGIFCSYNDGKRFEAYIKSLPPTTQKEKTGHWIRQTDDHHDYYECEHCSIAVGLDDIKNYCPNCGAKMVEPQDSEDKG